MRAKNSRRCWCISTDAGERQEHVRDAVSPSVSLFLGHVLQARDHGSEANEGIEGRSKEKGCEVNVHLEGCLTATRTRDEVSSRFFLKRGLLDVLCAIRDSKTCQAQQSWTGILGTVRGTIERALESRIRYPGAQGSYPSSTKGSRETNVIQNIIPFTPGCIRYGFARLCFGLTQLERRGKEWLCFGLDQIEEKRRLCHWPSSDLRKKQPYTTIQRAPTFECEHVPDSPSLPECSAKPDTSAVVGRLRYTVRFGC